MKNSIIFFMLLHSFMAFSQPEDQEYKCGIGLQINQIRKISQLDEYIYNVGIGQGMTKDKSYSIGITPSYYLNKNFSFRIRTDITRIKVEYSSKEPIIMDEYNANIKQINYELAVGISWLYRKEKISFGGGFELPFSLYGDFQHSDSSVIFSGGMISFSGANNYILPGGKAFGIGAFTNFNVFLFTKLSAGFQLSSAWLFYKIGGYATEQSWTYDANGILIGQSSMTRDTKIQQFVLSRPIASLNISMFF